MGRIAVIGERARVQGFALAGATTHETGDADAVRQAWASLPADVDVVVLTPLAAAALDGELTDPALEVLPVVMPP